MKGLVEVLVSMNLIVRYYFGSTFYSIHSWSHDNQQLPNFTHKGGTLGFSTTMQPKFPTPKLRDVTQRCQYRNLSCHRDGCILKWTYIYTNVTWPASTEFNKSPPYLQESSTPTMPCRSAVWGLTPMFSNFPNHINFLGHDHVEVIWLSSSLCKHIILYDLWWHH